MFYNTYMRKSVERHKHELDQQTADLHRRTRRVILTLTMALLVAATTVTLLYLNWHERQNELMRSAAQKKQFITIDARLTALKQARLARARKTEAKARTESIPQTTSSNPASTTSCAVSNLDSITVVINKKHCFSPTTWAPTDLTTVDGYSMRREAARHMNSMMTAASAAGVGFSISSAYRSYDDQASTYDSWAATDGSYAAADTVSARPGYSEHQTGLAADLKVGDCVLECFGTTAQYAWLTQHAAAYGFIQRYPEGLTALTGYDPEVWHWRYVGSSVAQDMQANGIKTLEAYYGISGGNYYD